MIERLDSPSGGHLYRMANQQDALAVPGATTIIDATMVEPAQLREWSRRQDIRVGIEQGLGIALEVGTGDYPGIGAALDQTEMRGFVAEAIVKAYAERTTTMDAGTAAHEEIAAWLEARGDGCDAEDSAWTAAAAAVVAELDLESWQVEVPGIRLPHYGGTIDLLGTDSTGTLHLVDWKTTDSDYLAEVRYREAVQVAAYSGLQIDVGGDLGLVALDDVRGHVARVASDGRAVLCEVDVDALWLHWTNLLDQYRREMGSDRGWFIKRTRRLP